MIRYSPLVVIVALVAAALAGDPPGDRQLIQQAAAQQTPAVAPPPARPAVADDVSQTERQARIEANRAVARLELILARKLLAGGDNEQAARKAHHVLVLLRQLPPEIDVSEWELQAEGILARAAKAGVDVAALARDATEDAPLLPDDAELDRRTQGAARVARQYSGPPRADVDQRGDARALRERTLRRQVPDRHGYRPGREILDVDAVLATDRQRTQYQAALREAYKADEVRVLVEADESRLVADGVVAYPSDWPERTRKRQQWADGVMARSASWYDKDGREWYVAIYDIRDLIYVPPDFGLESQFLANPFDRRNMRDRAALLDRGWMFGGWGAGGTDDVIPLLRYFGGVNAWIDRGPKYSLERQREIVNMIRAFTGGRVDEPLVLPAAPN